MKPLYMGTNLKMYKNNKETVAFLRELQALTLDIDRRELELFVIPSYTALQQASACVDHRLIRIGAQNMCWEEQGQFTGEISPLMLEELGMDMVMIGHSERRHVFRETDAEEGKKVVCAVAHGFRALLCVGETEAEKESGISDEVLRTQLIVGLRSVDPADVDRLMVAYEPVWAIGVNGKPATAAYAQEKHSVIKRCLRELFGAAGDRIPVLYGGSVNPQNAQELIVQPGIDGLFIGRSAWQAQSFYAIIRDVMKLRP